MTRAIGIDAEGKVIHDLFDPAGIKIAVVTSAQERRLVVPRQSQDTAWAKAQRPPAK